MSARALDLRNCESTENVARGLHAHLCRISRSIGQNPDIEVYLCTPERSLELGTGENWRVIWESGPFEWAVHASLGDSVLPADEAMDYGRSCEILFPAWCLTEPYYSFDICFSDER